jgi:hypothetical protein
MLGDVQAELTQASLLGLQVFNPLVGFPSLNPASSGVPKQRKSRLSLGLNMLLLINRSRRRILSLRTIFEHAGT